MNSGQTYQDSLLIISLSMLVPAILLLLIYISHAGSASPNGIDWTCFFLVVATSIITFTPAWLQLQAGQFDLFHPLVYPALVFILPNVLIKGMYLALGGYSTTLMGWGATKYFDLALICTALGWVSMIVGFNLPAGVKLARSIRSKKILLARLDRWQATIIPLGVGLICTYYLGREGAFGSSLNVFRGSYLYVSVLRPFSEWPSMCLFLLAYGVVRHRNMTTWRAAYYLAFAAVLALSFLSGSRGQCLYAVLMVMFARSSAANTKYSPRKVLTWSVGILILGFISFALVTQYRTLRQNEYGYKAISFEGVYNLLHESAASMLSSKIYKTADYVGEGLIVRFNAMDLLALTLERYDSLKAAEAQVGINNNIVKDLVYGFIPRFIWHNKPITGKFGLWFSRLYSNTRYMTWSGPTVIGDLYRNFNYWGIPLGMIIVGIYLRFIYEMLCLYKRSAMSALCYYFMLIAINWEGGYSGFVTMGLRYIFTIVILFYILKALGGFRQVSEAADRRPKFPAGQWM